MRSEAGYAICDLPAFGQTWTSRGWQSTLAPEIITPLVWLWLSTPRSSTHWSYRLGSENPVRRPRGFFSHASYSRGTGDRKSTLVFCLDLAHVRELTQTFCNAGIDARHVDSKTPVAERKSLVEGFKAGEYPVLVNCGTSSIPPYSCHKYDVLRLFSGLDRGCRYSQHRLRCRCPANTVP